jgi:hypothetical protein
MNSAALRDIGSFLFHLLIATLGVIFLSTLMFYATKPLLALLHVHQLIDHDVGLTIPFFPYQCIVGLCMGFWISKRFESARKCVVRWVWLVPGTWFMLLCAGSSSPCWQHLVWSMAPWDKRIQLISTLPFLTSLCYALGNLLGIKTNCRRTDVLAE